MQYDEFVKQVRQRAGLEQADAERVTTAVIETLGERLDRREREPLEAQLPRELKGALNHFPATRQYQVDEFFDRVAERAEIGVRDAMAQTRIVLNVLKEAVTPGDLNKILFEMPDDYRVLLGG